MNPDFDPKMNPEPELDLKTNKAELPTSYDLSWWHEACAHLRPPPPLEDEPPAKEGKQFAKSKPLKLRSVVLTFS